MLPPVANNLILSSLSMLDLNQSLISFIIESSTKLLRSLTVPILNDLDILFFHDIITPYQLKRKNIKLWNEKKKIIVLHSNGEIFKMLFSYYPKLKESPKTKFFYENNIAISVLNDVDQIVLLSEYAKQIFLKLYLFHLDLTSRG